jgi:prepilin-type processing-associated H-X9-DG protein
MNGGKFCGGEVHTKLTAFDRASERMVFLDDYFEDWDACWAVWYEIPQWWNPLPMRHTEGTTLAFADGHSVWWRWQDERTIAYGNEDWWTSENGWGVNKNQPDNPDLQKLQRAAWGKLGY